MRRFRTFQYAAAAVASLGFVLPPAAWAADTNRAGGPAGAAETPSILDVCLGEGGTLVGQVVDAQGTPLSQTSVSLRRGGVDLATAVTDAEGSFSIAGLTGGMYEVRSAGGSGMFRLWTAGASPPSAQTGVLLVSGQQVSRGQNGRPQPCYRPATQNRLIWGGIVIGAIAGGITAWAVSENRSSS